MQCRCLQRHGVPVQPPRSSSYVIALRLLPMSRLLTQLSVSASITAYDVAYACVIKLLFSDVLGIERYKFNT